MYNVYRVLGGDTLDDIAKRFGTSVIDLQSINNLTDDVLRAGEEVIVPETSKKYNINPELLASLNGLNYTDYIYPEQVIMIPKANYSYYVTKAGDTLDSVAGILNVSRDKLLNENNIIYLLEGQLLVKEKR